MRNASLVCAGTAKERSLERTSRIPSIFCLFNDALCTQNNNSEWYDGFMDNELSGMELEGSGHGLI
jgi:hypothetical protein